MAEITSTRKVRNKIKIKGVLTNQTWVCSLMRSKANLLTPGYGERKCSVYCKAPIKGEWVAGAQKPRTP